MGETKISDEHMTLIRHFLSEKWSTSRIIKEMKKRKVTIGSTTVSRIRRNEQRVEKSSENKENHPRPSKLNRRQINWLEREISKPNPPTQKSMANVLSISPSGVRYHIKKLDKKLVKKPHAHRISDDSKEKRRKRSWPLYLRLRGRRFEKFITSDEAWFYLSECNGQRKVQYISRDQNRTSCESYTKWSKSKGIMVWAAISCSGKAKLRFIEPGCKINANYYVENVLKPFIREDIPRLYPDGNFVFHQDSAPAHAAKLTCAFLDKKKVTFIRPENWMPNSPDASPCDFFLWGYLKSQINKLKIESIAALKNAIRREFRNVPQDMIYRAMRSWPRRCRQIYCMKGGNIEKK